MVAHLKQEEVYSRVRELAGGSPPGSKAFLAKYQTGLKYIVDGLPLSERRVYETMAKEWSEEAPAADVQRK